MSLFLFGGCMAQEKGATNQEEGAQRRIHTAEWNRAKANGIGGGGKNVKVKGIRKFIEDNPDSPYLPEAIGLFGRAGARALFPYFFFKSQGILEYDEEAAEKLFFHDFGESMNTEKKREAIIGLNDHFREDEDIVFDDLYLTMPHGTDLTRWHLFLNPESKFLDALKERIEEQANEAWEYCKKSDTPIDYQEFMWCYPDSRYFGKARNLVLEATALSGDLKPKVDAWVRKQVELKKKRELGDGRRAKVVRERPVLAPNELSVKLCIRNLATIDGVKKVWAEDNEKLGTDTPEPKDLYSPPLYIRIEPVCPEGGTYTIGAVKDLPTCSHPGHVFKR
ncbi:hypothetical protein N9B94_02355 [Verrucomicrobia bacterium]|nr:hypothetical protein [Verrucomicrobiota bacterium]